ncbi:MAG: hypothetical protein QM539_07700 [Alphaproteobacteria bacterium]|nr:hypothetical protein [Alphaproteobacteria bacterium]
MGNYLARRQFIKNTTTVAIGGMLVSNINCKKDSNTLLIVKQTPLAFAYDALEPNIDARTMDIHYTKHAAGYAANLTTAVKENNITTPTIEDLLANISKYSETIRNNAGGHYNHEFFWRCL